MRIHSDQLARPFTWEPFIGDIFTGEPFTGDIFTGEPFI